MEYCSEHGKTQLQSLTVAVKTVVSDVVGTCEVILQMKNESWNGEFVDIMEGDVIPDQVVIHGIVETKGKVML